VNGKKAGLAIISVVFGMLIWGNQSSGLSASAERTLRVKLNYSGTGKLDGKHKIRVLLFDIDPATQEDFKPLATQSATAKDETVVFRKIRFSPVFVMAFYDKNGSGTPEPGSPTGLYGQGAGAMDPIQVEAGKTAEIVLTFDDSNLIP
jgi:hypothetical protein